MPQDKGRPHLEVADILHQHGAEFRDAYSPTPAQRRVMRHIETCRTAALGGHKDTCGTCGHVRISYNSCRDRHCPKCQSLKKVKWLEKRKRHLLPIPYFHVVFTLPSRLNGLALCNKRLLFDILFRSAAQTLLTIARDPKHLGARVGFTAVLHTWGQNLLFHPHLHCVVTGGALSDDGHGWVEGSPKYFLPVKVLGELFRGKFLSALKEAYEQEKIEFGGQTDDLRERVTWNRLLDDLYSQAWVVYAKPPFGGPEHVFRYLGRYTHRVAISNSRLQKLEGGRVTFTIKDYADGHKRKMLTITAVEFIRRFLLHVLPRRFVRIRHYGLLASRNINTQLAHAKSLLIPPNPEPEDFSASSGEWWELLLHLTGEDIMACSKCGGRMQRTELDARQLLCVVANETFDTS